MKKKITNKASNFKSVIRKVIDAQTRPFRQTPSKNQFSPEKTENSGEVEVSDLFSHFTADIIKKDVVFTR